MFKFLKGVVGSGGGIKDLPYNIGEPYSSAWGSWTHYRGTSKDDNSPVSIFSLVGTSAQDGRLVAARNGAKRLRTVRHPNILSYIHSTEAETIEGGVTKQTIYVVTEPVTPLAEKIKELNLKGTQRDEFFAWGLHQVTKAVSFLNNDCKLVHGNVCVDAVVVTPTLDWKLHAFDVLSEFDGGNPAASGPMLQYEYLVAPQYKSQELAKNDWATIRKSSPWALDSWGLGCLIYELFLGSKLTRTEDLRNTQSIPKTLLPDYQRLLGSVPSRRMNPSKLIENSEFFQNKLVETIQFMEVLNLKDSVEKDSFFRKLSTLIEQLPREIVLRKLLPLLASALEFGSAAAPALNPLLKMGSWLSQDDFNAKVLPTVVKLFASTDRAIRVGLLQHIESFGNGLSTQVVDEQIFPHVATGFSDSSAFLRELTLKSMLVLSQKLSQRTVTGSLLKYLSKLQVDEEPAIRTNTTILLGNIAGHLNEATRKRVLINAFTVRALRDGFAPARGAGIMALTATVQYYDATEIATRILPHLVVLTVDGDSDVRSKAFQATESFLQAIKQYYEKMSLGGDTAASSASASGLSVNSGLLGWAVSSLTVTKTKADIGATVTSQSSETSSPEKVSRTSATSVSERPPPPPVSVHTSSYQPEAPAVVSPTSDGWGDIGENGNFNDDDDADGWGDMGLAEEPALARIHAAQQRPVSVTKTQVSTTTTTVKSNVDTSRPSAPVRGHVEIRKTMDDDDDPWASIAAPPPSSTARPLSSASSASSGRGSLAPRGRAGQHVSIGQHVSLEKALGGSGASDAGRGGRGRGRAAPMKLGAQRVTRPPQDNV
ncbi:hypothetical protein R1sor_012510 [Riccia sorocarpa]|uniref:Protein kinase domain-containing protein n=1 Tax=Riccia sorocarpa TaxID=122646 RepID=A0ABD3IA66_9MARC